MSFLWPILEDLGNLVNAKQGINLVRPSHLQCLVPWQWWMASFQANGNFTFCDSTLEQNRLSSHKEFATLLNRGSTWISEILHCLSIIWYSWLASDWRLELNQGERRLSPNLERLSSHWNTALGHLLACIYQKNFSIQWGEGEKTQNLSHSSSEATGKTSTEHPKRIIFPWSW